MVTHSILIISKEIWYYNYYYHYSFHFTVKKTAQELRVCMLNLIKNLSGGREACRRPVTFSWRQISSWECSRNESPDLTLLSSFGLLGVLPVCDRKPRAVEVIAVVHVGQPPSLVQGDKKRSNWVDQMEDIWCSISNPIPLPLSLFLSLSLTHTHTHRHTHLQGRIAYSLHWKFQSCIYLNFFLP